MPPINPAYRHFTCDVAIFGIDNNLDFSSAADMLAIFTECQLSINKDMAEAFVPKDTVNYDGFFYQRTTEWHWELTLGKLVDGSQYGATLLLMALTDPTLGGSSAIIPPVNNGGMVAVKVSRPGIVRGRATDFYGGIAFITEARFRLNGQEATMESGTLTGYGRLGRYSNGVLVDA